MDHVAEVTVVLSSGEVVTFGGNDDERASMLADGLGAIRDAYAEEIEVRFPKILRSNGGYGLDRLGPPGAPADPVKILCGSEGTLGVVVRAVLNLVPVPRHRGLCVLHFRDLFDALETAPRLLAHQPSAVELVDRMIIEAGRRNPALSSHCAFLQDDPDALLVVEMEDVNDRILASRLAALAADVQKDSPAYAAVVMKAPSEQEEVWALRRAGLGLLMARPGDRQSYAFVEDTAVAPNRLAEYIRRFRAILDAEGVEAGCYAHASVGCLHVRPVLNLKKADDVERMRRIAEAVVELARSFGGTMTGEHGDGIVRSRWLERLYGPRIIEAFRRVKTLFDPAGLLNPGKIVDPLPMTEHLRFGPDWRGRTVKTHLDFREHGGLVGLASMCSGVGACRQRLVGTMCPSYLATGDETHTTRARANALRIALSNRAWLEGLSDPALEEVMDLCIACKACKRECPTGVDMARMKAEYLAHRHLRQGVPPRARFVADLPARLRWMSKTPRLCNLIARSRPVRTWLQLRLGLDARMPLPHLARRTFRAWYRRHRRKRTSRSAPRGTCVYFVDTWTNPFTPEVGIATVRLLEAAGFDVVCPETLCCGRPAISQGLLQEAAALARHNVRELAPYVSSGVPIVGTEPSCLSTFRDEVPQLVRTPDARMLADRVVMVDALLRRLLDENPAGLRLADLPPLLFHAHCHQKALWGVEDAAALLRRLGGDRARVLDAGCCGMAGAFGHELEHYDIAGRMGEQRLFPAVRARGSAKVAVTGFSCRQQIEHRTGVRVRHLVEYLADAVAGPPG
ncbi:MAG: oxidoreductase [Planctomycetota bacterium]|nr:MAG: oxidoreductase [Planctomycetota bacterium]